MEELCVCAETLGDRAFYGCGHELCINCTLKKRVLQKNNQCPYCRTPSDQVVMVGREHTGPAPQVTDDMPTVPKASMVCENAAIQKKVHHILNYPCPSCGKELHKYHHLKEHLVSIHKKTLCDVCTHHELQFSRDYELYPLQAQAVQHHLKEKHLKCKYCVNAWFYGLDEFAKHCRNTHQYCPVCEREDPSRPRYFENYDKLKNHMLKDHFMCLQPQCLEERYIVFGTDLDLHYHMIEEHPMLVKGNGNGRNGRSAALHAALTQDEARAEERLRNNKPAEPADPHALAAQRFKARLEIDAKHDKAVIDKINTANDTYVKLPMPLSVHLTTYERLLPHVSAREITLLLEEFSKSVPTLSDDKKRELAVVLDTRQLRERQEEDRARVVREETTSTKKKGPARAPGAGIGGWSSAHLTGNGRTGLENLPRLPSRQSTPSFLNAPSLSTAYSRQSTPSISRSSTPTLRQAQSARQTQTSVRQTSVPMRQTRTLYSSAGYAPPLNNLPTLNSRQSASPTPESSTAWDAPSKADLFNSMSEPATQRPSPAPSPGPSVPRQGIDLNRLPSLPQQKETKRKPAKGRVLRLV